MYEGCSKSNVSYFITSAHNTWSKWWYGKRDQTSRQHSFTWYCCVTDASRGVVIWCCMKKRCVNEFLHVEKIASIEIRWCLLNIYGDQTVDVSTMRHNEAQWGTMRQWVVCFSSGDVDSGSHLLMQAFRSTACRLLFITSENTQLMVVTMLKNSIF